MKTRFLVGAALGSILVAASCSSATEEGGPATTAPDEPVGAAAAAEVGQAPAVAPKRARLANGLLPGMKAYHAPGKQIDVAAQCQSPALTYYGGPILQSPVIVAVFWNGNVNSALTAPTTGIGQFYADVTQSSYWSWLQEYDTVGLTGGTEQAILPGSFGGQFTITPTHCPTTTSTTNCKLTDAELQTELNTQIANGVLPAPTLDCTGNTNTIYMVSFPPHISLSGPDGSGTSCVQFCAYHNTGTYSGTGTANGKPLVYAALMDEFTGTCATGCGANSTGLANSTDSASHELVEAVTDADIGLDTQNGYANPAAWGDNNNQCGEIGDICDANSAGDTITVSGRKWVVQELWSNKQGKCTSTGPDLPVCSGTTLTNCRKCSCGDTGNACTGGTGVCETTSSNVLFGACEQCTSTDSAACGTSACTQSTTTTKDDVCASTCVPVTTCPVGDNCGTVSDGCGGTVTCGTCTAPQSCGGSGTANVCGAACTPITTCPAGADCGTLSNGCGGTITCGTCTGANTCGGGGVANQCGGACVPATTCPAGQTCGTAPDGCGGTIACGTCTLPQTCGGAGVATTCGCTPRTACATGDNCGTVPDGCGGTIACGTCTSPQVCGAGSPGVANQCGCAPITSCSAGYCGLVPDGCGGMFSCGSCASNQVCTANVCVAAGATTSSSSSGTTSTSSSGSMTASSSSGGGAGGGTTTSTSSSSSSSSGGGAGGGTTTSTGVGGATFGAGGAGGAGGASPAGTTTTGSGPFSGTPGQTGGCSCEAAGETSGSSSASLSAFGALALAVTLRNRRRRSSN